MIAADCSNYARVPSAADVSALKALGVSRVIVGTSFSHDNGDGTYTYIGGQQCAVFEAAGFEVQEYQFIGRHYATTRAWWLDVEQAETVDQIREAIATTQPNGIYTRRGIWDLLDVDLLSEFPGLKLWDANYGPLPRTFIPYGGWTKADMTQYHDTMDIGTGFEVDLSEYEEEAVDAPTKGEFQALFRLVIETSASLRAIADAFATHVRATGGAAPSTSDNAPLVKLQTEIDALEARQTAAAAALAG